MTPPADTPKRKPGRPRKEIDPKLITRLAAIGCTVAEVAACCDCSVDTIERNYADILQRGRELGKRSLRRMQWKAAKGGNVAMLIWLGKNLLGQKEPREEHVQQTDPALLAAIAGITRPNGRSNGHAEQPYDA